MSINSLFESKKVKLVGFNMDTKIGAFERWYESNSYSYNIQYKTDEKVKTSVNYVETLQYNNKDRLKVVKSTVKEKTSNLEKVFGEIEKEVWSMLYIFNLKCIGIFYEDTLIAITNEEGKLGIDPLLNEVKAVEEFKKEFIKLKEVELEKERYMCEKRAEEICAELSHIIKETL